MGGQPTYGIKDASDLTNNKKDSLHSNNTSINKRGTVLNSSSNGNSGGSRGGKVANGSVVGINPGSALVANSGGRYANSSAAAQHHHSSATNKHREGVLLIHLP